MATKLAIQNSPKLGDERYLVEMIQTDRVEAMARKHGWDGEDGLREFCEPEDAALWSEHQTLDAAIQAAREWLATGKAFYGCVIIDHEVFERWRDDRGNAVKHADWERQRSYEVANDEEVIEVSR